MNKMQFGLAALVLFLVAAVNVIVWQIPVRQRDTGLRAQPIAAVCNNGMMCTSDAECGGGICSGIKSFCSLTLTACQTDVDCPAIPSVCNLQPDGKGFCSDTNLPCLSPSDCHNTIQTCVVQPGSGSCQQCPSTGLCGNGTCDYSGSETSLTCPLDCKNLTVDPTHGLAGSVARLFSTQMFDGGERWFVDSRGVETHQGPYTPDVNSNGHGFPMPIPGGAAAGLGRIELRSSSFAPNIDVEAYVPFTVDPGASCQTGLSCQSNTDCGSGICRTGMVCSNDYGRSCANDAQCAAPGRCVVDISAGTCDDGSRCGFDGASTVTCRDNSLCRTTTPPACQCAPTAVCGNGMCEAGEGADSCPLDCQMNTCTEGAQCSDNDNKCGTGTCVNKVSRCARTGLSCNADGSCPSTPIRCVERVGTCDKAPIACRTNNDCVLNNAGTICSGAQKVCENSDPIRGTVSCTTDADCGVIPDVCSTLGSCSCAPQIIDTDKDGVADTADLCSNTPEGEPVDAKGCSDTQVDGDADGVCNQNAVSAGPSQCSGKDQCEEVAGTLAFQGCPAGLRVSVQVIDAQAKQKTDADLRTRIFDASSTSCAELIGTNTPLNFGNIFNTCNPENTLVVRETNSINRMVADLVTFGVTSGPKFVLVESPVGTDGNVAYQAFNVSVSAGKTVDVGFLVTPADSTTFVQNSYFSRNSLGNYNGARKQTITGSLLEVYAPTHMLWTGEREVYPYIFVSDSDWDVNVCMEVPKGYDVLETADCQQMLVANEMKVVEFTVAEVGSPEPNMKLKVKATHEGKAHNISQDIPGRRVQAKPKKAL